ncbi:anti-sigma factor [Streptomyces sp. CRN 30]|uniref:anti-sigma factor n=1 Tax=Streptomyces sp. CRN 30 TaxID=3075613 RepID=UPI002A8409A0|nr:anti-sigma factor [Streptomyces sp. CRN 30]
MRIWDRLRRRGGPHSFAAPYALNALEPAERVRFERHLERCGRCAAEVRRLTEDTVRLACSTAVSPPPALRERVLAAVATTPQEPATSPRESAPAPRLPPHVWNGRRAPGTPAPRRSLFVPFATATAAAALVVAALFAVQADRTRDELNAERDRAGEIAEVLSAPDARADADQDARGRGIGVVASAAEGRAVVTLSGYGALPGDRVHQLWLMRPGTQPRSLGVFAADAPLIASGLDRSASSLAVTVEPDGGSEQPTSSPIVQLALESVGFGE